MMAVEIRAGEGGEVTFALQYFLGGGGEVSELLERDWGGNRVFKKTKR